jgi:hypothetical protein
MLPQAAHARTPRPFTFIHPSIAQARHGGKSVRNNLQTLLPLTAPCPLPAPTHAHAHRPAVCPLRLHVTFSDSVFPAFATALALAWFIPPVWIYEVAGHVLGEFVERQQQSLIAGAGPGI